MTGRNCRFLQGPDTDSAAVDRVRAAIRDERDIRIDILNYRKDGSTFKTPCSSAPCATRTERSSISSPHSSMSRSIIGCRPKSTTSRPGSPMPKRRSGTSDPHRQGRVRNPIGSRPADRATSGPRRARVRSTTRERGSAAGRARATATATPSTPVCSAPALSLNKAAITSDTDVTRRPLFAMERAPS